MTQAIRSIIDHPIWDELAPYVRKEKYDRDGSARKPRNRFELAKVPPELLRRALAVRIGCCRCGKPISPIRARQGEGDRMELPRHLYLAVACPLDVNIGCSRGRDSKNEYLRLSLAVGTRT